MKTCLMFLAVAATRLLARKAPHDKLTPNIIIKTRELGKKTLTIKLTKAPLTDLLHYLAELTGTKLTYDRTAVMFGRRTE